MPYHHDQRGDSVGKEVKVHLAFINLALSIQGLGKNTSGEDVAKQGQESKLITSLVV